MVGDMWSDVAFGHRAGTQAALVLSGVATIGEARQWRAESTECSPDIVLHDVRGLVDPARVALSYSRYRDSRTSLWRRQHRIATMPIVLAALGIGVLFCKGCANKGS
mmetsp:Transcript_51916/g.86104  ORF Transcript_51916/g.86104 Transcript_51916/m.86104 type:complete len:107 (+) Transcript_51916:293-613(+)